MSESRDFNEGFMAGIRYVVERDLEAWLECLSLIDRGEIDPSRSTVIESQIKKDQTILRDVKQIEAEYVA